MIWCTTLPLQQFISVCHSIWLRLFEFVLSMLIEQRKTMDKLKLMGNKLRNHELIAVPDNLLNFFVIFSNSYSQSCGSFPVLCVCFYTRSSMSFRYSDSSGTFFSTFGIVHIFFLCIFYACIFPVFLSILQHIPVNVSICANGQVYDLLTHTYKESSL